MHIGFSPRATQVPLVALFSVRLRRWRQSKGIPLKRVAADLGVSISVISAWENGEYFPSAAHLEQVSAYAGIPVWQFFYPQPGDRPNSTCISAMHP
jgi:transcriptional regulator with XRE-family HTH domain